MVDKGGDAMGRISEERVLTLERTTTDLQARVRALEAQLADAPATVAPASAAPPHGPRPAAQRPAADPAAATWPAPTTTPAPAPAPAPAAAAPAPAPAAAAPASAPALRRERLDLEELLGGRVLAWTGGVAVLAGIAFLLAI